MSARTEGLTQLLAELDAIPGVSGAEEEVAEFVKGELNGCYDQFGKDALGNHLFTKKGVNPQLDLMLSAHMDEVGVRDPPRRREGVRVFHTGGVARRPDSG